MTTDPTRHEGPAVACPTLGAMALGTTLGRSKRTLTLANQGLTDDQLATLVPAMAGRSSLRSLNLRGNLITDVSVVTVLALMEGLPGLEVCNLSENSLSLQGCTQLLRWVLDGAGGLTAMNLDGNPGMASVEPALCAEVAGRLAENRQGLRQRRARRQEVGLRREAVLLGAKQQVLIAIVGGGIGGLALARALCQRGIACRVFERDACLDSRHQGYGLTMQQGTRAIKELEIGDAVAAASTWSSRHFIFDETGRVVVFWGPTFRSSSKPCQRSKRSRPSGAQTNGMEVGGSHEDESGEVVTFLGNADEPEREMACAALPVHAAGDAVPSASWRKIGGHNLHIPRQALREVLLRSLPAGVVSWGSPLAGFAAEPMPEGGSKVRLTFGPPGRESVVLADAVVGCDGIHSRVRHHLIGDRLRYLGVFVMLGIFPSAAMPLCHQRVFQTSDGHTRLFVMPFNCTSSMWQLSFRMPEAAASELARRGRARGGDTGDVFDGNVLREEALMRCGTWHDPVPEMFRTTPSDNITGYPVYDRNTLSLQRDEKGELQLYAEMPPMDGAASADIVATATATATATADITDITAAALESESHAGDGGGGGAVGVGAEAPTARRLPGASAGHPLATLLGDAAHCMSPFKGQGANQALLDAVSLADCLMAQLAQASQDHAVSAVGAAWEDGSPQPGALGKLDAAAVEGAVAVEGAAGPLAIDLAPALRAYEAEMLARTTRKVEDSRASVAVLHDPAFVETDFQLSRKGFQGMDMMHRIYSLDAAGIGAWDAASGRLDAAAFSL